MAENDFLRQQQAAVERMREMNARARSQSNYRQPTQKFSFQSKPQNQNQKTKPLSQETIEKKQTAEPSNKASGGFNIPFLDMLTKDKDTTLIIGLLLILMSENSDKILLFALVYILL